MRSVYFGKIRGLNPYLRALSLKNQNDLLAKGDLNINPNLRDVAGLTETGPHYAPPCPDLERCSLMLVAYRLA